MSTATLPRPAERVAIVSLFLVFLCGAVLGAVVMSLWGHTTLHGSRPGQAGMTVSIREWKEKLDLTDDQTRQLTELLDDFTHYYGDLSADGNTRILRILNPDQKLKYERMMAEHKSKSDH